MSLGSGLGLDAIKRSAYSRSLAALTTPSGAKPFAFLDAQLGAIGVPASGPELIARPGAATELLDSDHLDDQSNIITQVASANFVDHGVNQAVLPYEQSANGRRVWSGEQITRLSETDTGEYIAQGGGSVASGDNWGAFSEVIYTGSGTANWHRCEPPNSYAHAANTKHTVTCWLTQKTATERRLEIRANSGANNLVVSAEWGGAWSTDVANGGTVHSITETVFSGGLSRVVVVYEFTAISASRWGVGVDNTTDTIGVGPIQVTETDYDPGGIGGALGTQNITRQPPAYDHAQSMILALTGATAFSALVDFAFDVLPASVSVPWIIRQDGSNRLTMELNSSGNLILQERSGGAVNQTLTVASGLSPGRHRVAFRYQTGTACASSYNGGAVQTAAGNAVWDHAGALELLYGGYSPFYLRGGIHVSGFWGSLLSDADLQAVATP